MKTRPHVFHLLLAGVLLAAPWQLSIAAPEAKPAAAKPAAKPAAKTKMAPRPVPGMSDSASDQAHKQVDPMAARSSSNISFAPKPASSKPAASGKTPASGAPQARILMIYRSGTFEPLPADPAASPAPAPPLPEEVRPESAALSRPGQVRIISKAEADVLAAQPLR